MVATYNWILNGSQPLHTAGCAPKPTKLGQAPFLHNKTQCGINRSMTLSHLLSQTVWHQHRFAIRNGARQRRDFDGGPSPDSVRDLDADGW